MVWSSRTAAGAALRRAPVPLIAPFLEVSRATCKPSGATGWRPSAGPTGRRRETLAACRPGHTLVVTKLEGQLRGKQPKLKPAQEAHLVKLHASGEHTTAELAELAELFGVWSERRIAARRERSG